MLDEARIRVPRLQGSWRGEQLEDEVDVLLPQLPALLPSFRRVPLGRNRLKDLIVRVEDDLPVDTVSKKYRLIQHFEIIEAVAAAADAFGIDADGLRAHLTLTEYGTRMALRVILPKQYAISDPSGHAMALTFECFNSVDGTVPLFALVGWFRFVCRNGLAVGTTTMSFRQKHLMDLHEGDFEELIADGIRAAADERVAFVRWQATRVSQDALQRWVDGPVASVWGIMAAARVYSIATNGFDGEPERGARKRRPHRRQVSRAIAVPGSQAPCGNRYAAAQILAWIASRRNSVTERTAWRAQIGTLVKELALD